MRQLDEPGVDQVCQVHQGGDQLGEPGFDQVCHLEPNLELVSHVLGSVPVKAADVPMDLECDNVSGV